MCYNCYCDGDNMNYLYNLDLNENEILDIAEANGEVQDLSEEEMLKYIYVLIDIGCTQKQIHTIITSNPAYFSRDIEDVGTFLRKLKSYDVDVSLALEANPWLLNKDSFELDDLSQMNKYDRHIEHSEVYDEHLYLRSVNKTQSIEEQVEDKLLNEELQKAIKSLSDVQKRRINRNGSARIRKTVPAEPCFVCITTIHSGVGGFLSCPAFCIPAPFCSISGRIMSRSYSIPSRETQRT